MSVHKRATELQKGLEKMSYEGRLKTLSLSNLEKRRLSGDLMVLYGFLRKGDGGAEVFSLFESVWMRGIWL